MQASAEEKAHDGTVSEFFGQQPRALAVTLTTNVILGGRVRTDKRHMERPDWLHYWKAMSARTGGIKRLQGIGVPRRLHSRSLGEVEQYVRDFTQWLDKVLLGKRNFRKACLSDRLQWLLKPALSPDERVIHYHGYVSCPPAIRRTAVFGAAYRIWKKIFYRGSMKFDFLYEHGRWSQYAHRQRGSFSYWMNRHPNLNWLENELFLPVPI